MAALSAANLLILPRPPRIWKVSVTFVTHLIDHFFRSLTPWTGEAPDQEPESRKSRAVQRRPADTVRTAWPIALREPTRTTSFLARVTAV